MVVNGIYLLQAAPIKDMFMHKVQEHGVSHGLAEVGYDIRLKQEIVFTGRDSERFKLASAIEEFDMPNDLMAVVHDKSTWARMGLSVFNTVIEPGWKGFLTLELVYHGQAGLRIPAGSGIAQVIFHRIQQPAQYDGKYQNQADKPVEAIMAEQGPVRIVDANGTHPSALDRAIKEQREYYRRDQPDPSKRGFTPK